MLQVIFQIQKWKAVYSCFFVKAEFWALMMYCLHQWLSWNDVGDGEDIVMSLIISEVYLLTQLIKVQHLSVTKSPYVKTSNFSKVWPVTSGFPVWRHTISWWEIKTKYDVTELPYCEDGVTQQPTRILNIKKSLRHPATWCDTSVSSDIEAATWCDVTESADGESRWPHHGLHQVKYSFSLLI